MTVIFLISSLFIALLGFVIWRFERTGLLANVDQTRFSSQLLLVVYLAGLRRYTK